MHLIFVLIRNWHFIIYPILRVSFGVFHHTSTFQKTINWQLQRVPTLHRKCRLIYLQGIQHTKRD